MAHGAGAAAERFQAIGGPDEDVVRRVLAGDAASFELLMRRYNQRVYRTIRAVLRRDSADVEDAMQQTYLQAYQALAAFEGTSSFGTWLIRIALNAAFAVIRRRQRVDALALGAEVDEMTRGARDEGPEDRAARSEAAELLERAVSRLREDHRVVFMLREVEQLSTADTAEALELTEENVKVRLHRARLALRDLLAEEVGQSAPQAFTFLAPRCDRVVHAVLSAIRARLGPAPPPARAPGASE